MPEPQDRDPILPGALGRGAVFVGRRVPVAQRREQTSLVRSARRTDEGGLWIQGADFRGVHGRDRFLFCLLWMPERARRFQREPRGPGLSSPRFCYAGWSTAGGGSR